MRSAWFSPDRANDSDCKWRPVALQSWYLFIIALLCVGLAASMEYCCRHYNRNDDSGLFSFHDDLSDLSLRQYFIWRILLALIVLLWGGLIASINFQLMRMAPFWQLGRPSGLSGRDALLRNPDSLWTYARHPMKGGPLVWLCFFNVLLADGAAPIVQSTVILSTNPPDTSLTGEAYMEAAAKRVSHVVIHPPSSRALSAIFLLLAMSCVLLIVMLWRGLGLRQDPGGISGAASLLIGSNVSRSLAISDVQSLRFELRNGSLGLSDSPPRYSYSYPDSTRASLRHSIYSKKLLSTTIVFGIFLCIFYGVSTYTNVVWTLRRVPWLIVAFAVLYQILWTQCETEFRVKEPFRQLCRREGAPSLILFVDYTGIPTILLPFITLRNRHWILSISAIAGNLVQLIIINATCLGDISSYIFVSSITYKGAPGDYASQYTEVTAAGSASLRRLFYSIWVYTMLLLALLSVWLGVMIGISVTHGKSNTTDDPVKLGVLLAWVADTDVLRKFEQMHRIQGAISPTQFRWTEGHIRWVLSRQSNSSGLKISRHVPTGYYECWGYP